MEQATTTETEAHPGAGVNGRRALEAAQAAVLARHAPGTRSRRIRWSGGTTQVQELGEGPPLLLVHGGFGDAFDWAPILPALARTRRVLAIDRPGHGLSDPFDYRGVDVLAHGRRFLAESLDALGLPRVDIVANSMGGLWSVALALEEPRRVSRLALVGAPAGMKRWLPAQLRAMRWPVVGAAVRTLMRRPSRQSTRSFWGQICVAHPERLSDEILDAAAASQRANCRSWFGLAERCISPGGLHPALVVGERWQRLEVPVLFAWGEHDAFGPPAEGQAVAATMKNARVVAVPRAGHLPWLDEPSVTTDAVLSFLAGT